MQCKAPLPLPLASSFFVLGYYLMKEYIQFFFAHGLAKWAIFFLVVDMGPYSSSLFFLRFLSWRKRTGAFLSSFFLIIDTYSLKKKIICITIILGTQYFFTTVNMICYNWCILKKMLVVNPSIRDILPSQQITIDHVNSKINSEK